MRMVEEQRETFHSNFLRKNKIFDEIVQKK